MGVKAYINCYTANSGYTNVSRRFRAAIEKGELAYEDYSQDVVMLALHAASLGLPFLPVRLMQGSGLTKYWGISEEQRKTLDKVDDLKYVEMDNPFNPGEKIVAVPVPKLDTAIIHVQKASPDGTCIIEGDEFHDVDIAVAARKVIVTCDELVSDEYIRRDPTLTRIFGECVDAVVHCPYGAWPSQCYNYYDNDSHALKEYDKASKYQDAEDAKAQLVSAQSQYTYYNSTLNSKTNITSVEETAGRLGLMKIDQSQITYIRLGESDTLERTQSAVRQWTDFIYNGAVNILGTVK